MTTIEFFFDVGSPYSYLAATQVPALAERTGAEVRWRPFLLGGVFKAAGNDMPARVPAKARWMLADLAANAAHLGVPFRMNSHFPVSTLAAQRALVAAESQFGPEVVPTFAMVLFRAMWVEDRDVSVGDELAACAAEAGLEVARLTPHVQSDETKARLKEITEEAVSRGAFGAPTFFVGQQMFFGHDRLFLVEEAAGGS